MRTRNRIFEHNLSPKRMALPAARSSADPSIPRRREGLIFRLQRSIGNRAVQRLLRTNSPHLGIASSISKLQRDPDKTTIRVDGTGINSVTTLAQGKGGSGAIVYDYSAHAKSAPADKDVTNKKGVPFDITLPVLVYPPAVINPPKIDLFVFFHGMRADYAEGKSRQGSENVALWTHLKEAVAGTNRLGIAPQAPASSSVQDVENPDDKPHFMKAWAPITAQWDEALTNVGFDGLVKNTLKKFSDDLGLTTPLVPGDIHIAGHSAGGKGIIEATRLDGGARAFADSIQDVTLQDAGYSFGWDRLIPWFLDGSPGKTVRVLISESQQKSTRNVLKNINVDKVKAAITDKKRDKGDVLEVADVPVPEAEDQKPRPGGFVLESELVVKNKKTGAVQATVVVFFAPGGGHYETTTASMGAAASAGAGVTTDFLGDVKPGKFRVIAKDGTYVYKDEDLAKALSNPTPHEKEKNLLLPLDHEVEVTCLEQATPAKQTKPRYVAKIKDPEGWIPLAQLGPNP